MKCKCKECLGSGAVECPECDGSGELDGGIETAKVEKWMNGYEDLLDLQSDARRVINQAKRLTELKPHHREVYAQQLQSVLLVINRQAEEVAKRK